MDIRRPKNKDDVRVKVDKSKLNLGNSYDSAPDYYYDKEFECRDCGSLEVWKAEKQKWWYEEKGSYFFTTAIRCSSCRKLEKERVEKARKDSGHA